jgi:hypothetical protein
MSTFAYATLTKARKDAGSTTRLFSGTGESLYTYLDALAALVPAEVIAAYAVIFDATSKDMETNGKTSRVITDPTTLKWSFIALIGTTVILYLVPRLSSLDQWDIVRVLIPPLAFVGWTMLLPISAFDALGVDLNQGARLAIPVVGSLILGVIASKLAVEADAA